MAVPLLGDINQNVRSILGDTQVLSSGILSTSGTAITWVSGGQFNLQWPSGTSIVINGISYYIASLSSSTAGLLMSSAGTQTNVPFTVSPGQLYPNSYQLPFIDLAYQELFTRLQMADASRVQRDVYFTIQPYQTVFYPSSFGILNLGQVGQLWERGSVKSIAITGVAINQSIAGDPAAVQMVNAIIQISGSISSTFNLSPGQRAVMEIVAVGGVSDDINDQWGAVVQDDTHLILYGCGATGTLTSGGLVLYSTESPFQGPLEPHDTTDDFPNNSTNSELGMYCFQRSVLKFPPVGAVREVKMTYTVSSVLPPTAGVTYSLGIDDSKNFLSNRAAQRCAESKGNLNRMKTCQDAAEYHLSILLSGAARALQVGEPIVPPPFRNKRNIRPFSY